MANISPLYKSRIFTFEDVMHEMKLSRSAASGALVRWQAQGLIKMIRRNLYTVIDLATNSPIVDKYELSSKITATSYVGWHTALELHGVAHQPFYNSYVGSMNRFNGFTFEDINFEYCSSPFEPSEENGVIRPIGNPYVKVTDLERTLIDCCDRIERAGGVEELLHCMEGVMLLDESKLEKYLNLYNKLFLFQKVGFILEQSKDYHHVSDSFLEMCHSKGAIHTQHLTNNTDSDFFVSRWKLYIPNQCVKDNTSEYELI